MIDVSRHRCQSLGVVVATAMALIASGCSMAYVRPYRPDATGRDPACTDSYAAPAADAALAAAATALPATYSAWEANRASSDASFGHIVGIFALAAILSIPMAVAAGSGLGGALQVHQCRSHREFAAQHLTPMQLQAAYRGPPGAY